jgi:parallel beta-helix repeat protein
LKVSNCVFTRYTGAGLAIDGNVATANVDDIVITNSTFDANKFGFMVMPHTTNVHISSSSFTNATLGGGIVLSRTDTATLDGLTVTGNNGNGIALSSSSNITLTNIKAERNSESGLVIGGNSSQISIECSSMIGNSGVRNESSPQVVVNAEQIYWGCPGGPGAAGCSTISGAVDVLPFRDTRDAPCTARLTGITVTPPSVTIIATPLPSIVMRLNATAIFAEGSPKEATALVTWSSSDNAVVTVAPGGVVTVVGPGLATISASNGGVSGIATMRVSADPIAR